MFLLTLLKTAAMALHVVRSYSELMDEAREAEAHESWATAAQLCERAIRRDPHDERPYNRLMIIYRKQKDYEKEQKVIIAGIKNFETFYREKAERLLEKNKSAGRLSSALAKALGQRGRNEKAHYPEPIPKWLKRLETVEKKLGRK